MGKTELLEQAAVQYRTAEEGIQSCSNCSNFQAPDKCAMVMGPVSAGGICDIWSPMATDAQLEDKLFGGAEQLAPTQIPEAM